MLSRLQAEIAVQVERVWAEMMAGATALDPDRIQAAYSPHPTVAVNGVILADFSVYLATVRPWLTFLRALDATYDNVHLEVLTPDAVVATINHHLRWTDAIGCSGEWHSAWTAVFRHNDDQWRIVYSHKSTPPHRTDLSTARHWQTGAA